MTDLRQRTIEAAAEVLFGLAWAALEAALTRGDTG